MWRIIALAGVILIGRANCCFRSGSRDGTKVSSSSLIFNGNAVTVNPNERLHLDCGVQGDFRYCHWENEDSKKTYQIQDVYGKLWEWDGVKKPANTRGNECGIVMESAKPSDHGKWTCKVFVVAKTLSGSKQVIVTVRPNRPQLNVNENPLVVMEGEETEIGCTVPAARPPVSFRWYIGTKDITSRSESENIPTDDMGTYRSVSTLKYKYHHLDDKRNLVCSIEHYTLQEPEYSQVPMDVRYQPYSLSSSQIYSIPISEEYEIKYNFTANPLPELVWYTGTEEIQVPGDSGRYMANIKKLSDNVYTATLKIRDFTQDDIGTVYRLKASNLLGAKEFEVSLSTGPAPPESLGPATVAAVAVFIIVIFGLLLIIGCMRYRQMYCFAMRAESKAYIEDSERPDLENNCRTNEAIKASLDQLNGRPETMVINGNGTVDHNNIESIAHSRFPPLQEKKNTDV